MTSGRTVYTGPSPKTMSHGAVFAVAAQAARDAADLEADAQSIGASAERDGANPEEARITQVLEANRLLHALVASARASLEEVNANIRDAERRLGSRDVEDPSRKSIIETTHVRLQHTVQGTTKTAKETEALRKDIAKMQARILDINRQNVSLADAHRKTKHRIQERQQKYRMQGKRGRELARQLDCISTALTKASKQKTAETNSKSADYRNLPGICVAKVVGPVHQKEPPVEVPAVQPQSPSPQRELTQAEIRAKGFVVEAQDEDQAQVQGQQPSQPPPQQPQQPPQPRQHAQQQPLPPPPKQIDLPIPPQYS